MKCISELCRHCGARVTYSFDTLSREGLTPLVGSITPAAGFVGWLLRTPTDVALGSHRFEPIVFCSTSCVESAEPVREVFVPSASSMVDAGGPAPLLLVHDSRGCSHKFVDSKRCLHCGAHCSDLTVEQLGPDGPPRSLDRARQVVRFCERFGEPTTAAGRERLEALREQIRKAER